MTDNEKRFIKSIFSGDSSGQTRVNDTGEETFGLLCFAEITEFAKELHSEMEKVVLMDGKRKIIRRIALP